MCELVCEGNDVALTVVDAEPVDTAFVDEGLVNEGLDVVGAIVLAGLAADVDDDLDAEVLDDDVFAGVEVLDEVADDGLEIAECTGFGESCFFVSCEFAEPKAISATAAPAPMYRFFLYQGRAGVSSCAVLIVPPCAPPKKRH